MGRTRFSIASLMAGVLFSAIAVSALSHPNEWWASTLYTLALGLLCWATVAALLSGRRRRFWTGFAVFGWAHLVVNFGLFGLIGGLNFFPPTPPTLYEKLMKGLEPWMLSWPAPTQPTLGFTPRPVLTTVPATATIVTPINQMPFHQTGRVLLTLLIAWVGGTLAEVAGRTRRPASSRDSRPGTPEGASVEAHRAN